MIVVERWVEKLRCPNCGKTGTARLSQADGWTVHVDKLPEGFYFIQSESGSNFYCSSCGTLTMTHKTPMKQFCCLVEIGLKAKGK